MATAVSVTDRWAIDSLDCPRFRKASCEMKATFRQPTLSGVKATDLDLVSRAERLDDEVV